MITCNLKILEQEVKCRYFLACVYNSLEAEMLKATHRQVTTGIHVYTGVPLGWNSQTRPASSILIP